MIGRVDLEFAPAKESASWADDAVDELHAAAKDFFGGNFATIVIEDDADTGEHVQKLKIIRQLPKHLRRKATESLTNSRHAFDQATFAARNLTSKRANSSIYFPWATDPTDLKRLLENRGIDQRIWGVFERHEPYPRGDTYPGGDDVMRTLAKMANDKHTIGLGLNGHAAKMQTPGIRAGSMPQQFRISLPRWDAMKNEAELARWRGDIEMKGDYNFNFEIVFKDPRFPRPVNVMGALKDFARKAQSVVEDLQRRCEELCA